MENKQNNKINIQQITQIALLFALSVVLMIVESFIPPIPTLPPGVKLGLSNIVIMYSLFFLGKKPAFSILVLKAFFVFITRGVTAFLLSFAGGLFSIIVMIILLLLKKVELSYILISVFASIAHNMAQLCVASLLLKTTDVFYYAPILVISGVMMGIVTGIILKVLLPAMRRIKWF